MIDYIFLESMYHKKDSRKLLPQLPGPSNKESNNSLQGMTVYFGGLKPHLSGGVRGADRFCRRGRWEDLRLSSEDWFASAITGLLLEL